MSYCRWSSDDFDCDLYCYESDSGYTTHVASSRVVGPVPKVGPFPVEGDENIVGDWAARCRAQSDYVSAAERLPIGLPFDGATFHDAELGEIRDRLLQLRAIGYRFPDHVLKEIEEEMAAESVS